MKQVFFLLIGILLLNSCSEKDISVNSDGSADKKAGTDFSFQTTQNNRLNIYAVNANGSYAAGIPVLIYIENPYTEEGTRKNGISPIAFGVTDKNGKWDAQINKLPYNSQLYILTDYAGFGGMQICNADSNNDIILQGTADNTRLKTKLPAKNEEKESYNGILVNRAMNLLNEYDQDRFEKVLRKEDLIDKYETRLGAYLMRLTKKELTTAQSRRMSLYLSTISDFERIGDHASYIAHLSNEMQESRLTFSEEAMDELNVVMGAVREVMNITAKAFTEEDQNEGAKVSPLGVVITNLCDELKHNHVIRLGSGACGLEEGTVFNDILNSFTRIAAHCASIVSAMEKSGEDGEDIHIHDSRVYAGEGMEYYSYFTKYSQKYDLGNESSHGKSMEAEETE